VTYRRCGGTNIEDEDNDEILALDNIRLARMYKLPKTLFDLWQEFQFGLNGEKPKKDSMYYKREFFWNVIRSLVWTGHTSQAVIDKVYLVYGRGTSVMKILLKMIRDRKEGGNPSLTV